MRITVVVTDLFDTGANRVTLDRAARWAAAGDRVEVFVALNESANNPVRLPPALTITPGNHRPRRLRTALPVALLRLLGLARRSDVVVAGTEVGFGLLVAAAASWLARRPLAVTVQAPADLAINENVEGWLRPVTRAALRHAKLAVCVGAGVAPSLRHLGLSSDRIVVAANAVDVMAIRVAAAEPPDPLPAAGPPIVVGSGRLAHEKGFDLLIRAHARALALGALPHRVVILGEGSGRDELTALTHELGVADSVALPGFTSNPHALVSRAALFVLSSRWEGFGLSLAEALACGTPCLAFDCIAGPSQVLAGGAYGRLVPAEDVHALATAICAHFVDRRPLRHLAACALDDNPEIFYPDRAASRHREALAALVAPAG